MISPGEILLFLVKIVSQGEYENKFKFLKFFPPGNLMLNKPSGKRSLAGVSFPNRLFSLLCSAIRVILVSVSSALSEQILA